METRLTTKEVAKLENVDERTVRRWAKSKKIEAECICNEFNSPVYLIPVSELTDGAQKKYFHQVKASLPTVAPAAIKKSKPFDHYSDGERQEIMWWEKTLKEWKNYRDRYPGDKAEADDKFVALCAKTDPEHTFSVKTLYRKKKQMETQGLEALIDKRGKGRQGASSIADVVWDVFQSFYLDEAQHPIQKCYEYTLRYFQKMAPELVADIPTYSTFWRRIQRDMPKYVTNTAVGYFIGKPVAYSSQDDAFLQALQDIFDYNDEQDENAELAKGCSISGSCFEMLYMDEDAMIRFAKIEPDNCILIYETGRKEPMAALRFIHSRDRDGNPVKKVEFWTSTECWYFVSLHGGPLELTDIAEHYWQDVPFIEYTNNEERLGDFEGILTLIDAYNRAQSNTANFFQYNDEAILKVMKIGDVQPRDIRDMKEAGAILLEDGGDIDWLIKEVADTALENYKKRLREDMHLLSSVPNLNDENFSGNLSGVALGYKLWGLEQICATKERKFKRALQRRIELITTMLNIQGGHYDYRDIDMQFRRNKPQNLLESAQIVTTLSGELSRESRLQLLPTVENGRPRP